MQYDFLIQFILYFPTCPQKIIYCHVFCFISIKDNGLHLIGMCFQFSFTQNSCSDFFFCKDALYDINILIFKNPKSWISEFGPFCLVMFGLQLNLSGRKTTIGYSVCLWSLLRGHRVQFFLPLVTLNVITCLW